MGPDFTGDRREIGSTQWQWIELAQDRGQ